MGLTDAQWQERRTFLGGTDMAAIAGLSPYAGPIDVYRDKVEARPPQGTTTMMAMGTLLEPVVAGLFSRATGIDARRPPATVRDRQRPWLGGHVDRYTGWRKGAGGELLGTYVGGVLECKWAMTKAGWGPASDVAVLDDLGHLPDVEVPPGYAVQVQHYLGVTGRAVGFLAVLLGYADFRWYAIARDDEAIATLRELGDRFWHDNVEPKVPPEPDGTAAYGRYLVDRYREDRGEELVATPAQQEWALALREATRRRKAAEADEAASRQRLQDSMGTAATLVLPFGQITWRAHTVQTVDWQGVARDLASMIEQKDEAGIERRLKRYAEPRTTTTTQRPFRPDLKEDDDAQD